MTNLGRLRYSAAIVLVSVLTLSPAASAQEPAAMAATVDVLYPGLATAVLTFSVPADLPDGLLVRSGEVTLDQKALDAEAAKAPEEMREQLRKNAFLVAEQLAGRRIILSEAGKEAAAGGADPAGKSEQEIIQAYFDRIVKNVAVTDEETQQFYAENKDMCGTATLEQISDQIKAFVLNQKQQAAVAQHVRMLGKSRPIEVSAAWVQDQSALAKDNVVDKARASGRPSVVDFGASGCRPCDMMTPILAALKTKYEGKANVLFIHVREEQFLAARYGIESIPVQVFFDKDGKEVFRHTGFFPQDQIETKLSEMGVE